MISIVIIVKNDFRISKLLNKIQQITFPDKTEIIVVDASGGLLDEIKKNNPYVKWIMFINKKNKARTYPEQRNIGIKNAKGNIIVFIDADCIPDKNWLQNLVKSINNENENIVSGAVKPINSKSIFKEEQYGKYREECETMNLAVTKEVITNVSLFDESMEGCEDSDYCIRVKEKGYKIRYAKDAIVYHDWGGFIQNISRSFNGGQDRMSLYKKYPKLFFSFSINNIYTWFYLFFILFLPITIWFPYYPFIVVIPSIIKMRNPIKEIYNLAFSIGAIFKVMKYLLPI